MYTKALDKYITICTCAHMLSKSCCWLEGNISYTHEKMQALAFKVSPKSVVRRCAFFSVVCAGVECSCGQ